MTSANVRCAIVVPLLLVGSAAIARKPVRAIADLPAPVAKLYEASCHADYWSDGKRKFAGSTATSFKDGSQIFLMVCGDAASVVPFAVLMLDKAGPAHEAAFRDADGKSIDAGEIGNAHFGPADTIVSSTHSSAGCEPVSTLR